METVVIRLDNGEVVEFVGELVARAAGETPCDARTVAEDAYRLFRTDQGRYVLVLDRFVKVRSKSFCLSFNTIADVEDYVGRDADRLEAARTLGSKARAGEGDGEG